MNVSRSPALRGPAAHLALLFSLFCGACGPDDHFTDLCKSDHDCPSPWECLELKWPEGEDEGDDELRPNDEPRMICSQTCEITSDCPSWYNTGHCRGKVQSSCQLGVCYYQASCK